MITPFVNEVFERVAAAKTESEKIQILKDNYSPALIECLHVAYSPKIKFFTDTIPKYNVDDSPEGLAYTTLFSEYRRLYMFYQESPIDPKRKVVLLTQMLEALSPKEAKVLESIIKQSIPEVSKELANKAFPGIANLTLASHSGN